MTPSARSKAAKVSGSLIHVNPAKGADVWNKVEEIEPIPNLNLGWFRRNFFQYLSAIDACVRTSKQAYSLFCAAKRANISRSSIWIALIPYSKRLQYPDHRPLKFGKLRLKCACPAGPNHALWCARWYGQSKNKVINVLLCSKSQSRHLRTSYPMILEIYLITPSDWILIQ